MKTFSAAAVAIVLAMTVVSGQEPALEGLPVSEAQRALESGKYDDALARIAEARERGEAGLVEAFLAGHAQLRRSQNDAAKNDFRALADSDDETWRRVGESSLAQIDGDLDRAQAVATEATAQIDARNAEATSRGEQPPSDPPARWREFAAFYQLGLVNMRREDWAGAAAAFDRAVALNPMFAYAHYYAGLAASRMKRPDQVARHFEVFLKLAPSAPERGAVTSMMRTLRGA